MPAFLECHVISGMCGLGFLECNVIFRMCGRLIVCVNGMCPLIILLIKKESQRNAKNNGRNFSEILILTIPTVRKTQPMKDGPTILMLHEIRANFLTFNRRWVN